jgi:hypothetical protein
MPSIAQLLLVGSMVVVNSQRVLADVVESRITSSELRRRRRHVFRRRPILKGGVDPVADDQMA